MVRPFEPVYVQKAVQIWLVLASAQMPNLPLRPAVLACRTSAEHVLCEHSGSRSMTQHQEKREAGACLCRAHGADSLHGKRRVRHAMEAACATLACDRLCQLCHAGLEKKVKSIDGPRTCEAGRYMYRYCIHVDVHVHVHMAAVAGATAARHAHP